MPLINKHKHPLGTIALWHITESPEQLQAMLTIDEFVPFKTERRNTHWLAARLALQEAIGNSSSKIIKNNQGKPFLADKDGHISITHSGNMSAAIFNTTNSCGIDLELFDSRITRIAHKFTTHAENWLFPEKFKTGCTCLNWCAKESVFKFGSIHEVDFKTQIQLKRIDFENQTMDFCFTRTEPEQNLKVYFRIYEVINYDVFETPLLTDEEMTTNERYILTWI
ncbi:MAG: 4'-phosphopantetheinyl transferase family protein [Bacteroidia bacterium]